jgi:dTDP-4-amino-4,6-dideoxygalactose transaminase
MPREYGEVELGYLREVLASGQLGTRPGGYVPRFEAAFARLVGSRYGVARNAATVTLVQALGLCHPGPGDEVICDPLVDFGVVAAEYFGATPRFADVDDGTFLMDAGAVPALITARTKAVVVTHLWGQCADLAALRRVCDEHGLLLVEDTAHVIGATWAGRPAGTYGDVAAWAFQGTKQLGLADAGMLTTDREDLYALLTRERAYGLNAPPFTLDLRMNELTGAVGLAQVARVPALVAEYTRSLERLDAALEGCAWLRRREVAPEANQVGYWWAAIWEGDHHGLDLARFKAVCAELDLGLDFGFNGTPAYNQAAFRREAIHHRREHTITDGASGADEANGGDSGEPPLGLCPVAEALIPRLVTCNLVEVPEAAIARRADGLAEAIRRTERG